MDVIAEMDTLGVIVSLLQKDVLDQNKEDVRMKELLLVNELMIVVLVNVMKIEREKIAWKLYDVK